MKTFDLRFMLVTATLAFLTACGGGAWSLDRRLARH